MSDEIRVNRSQQMQGGMQQPMMHSEMSNMQGEPNRKGSKLPWVILALVVIAIVVLGILFRKQLFKSNSDTKMAPSSSSAKGIKYQAVFLTNGQVYFGQISNPDGNYVILKDIYYLQVGPQQGSGTDPSAPAQQSISLVKLGNELHGPEDEMHISRSQILFYEDLKAEGSVVQAIDAYKANPEGAPAQ